MTGLSKIIRGLLGVGILASVMGAEVFGPGPNPAQALAVSGAAPNWFEAGEEMGDRFSAAFAAGDINSDGYADLIAGAPGYSSGRSQGQVYAYYGGPAGLVRPTPQASLLGDSLSNPAYFGSALACADLNGDSYAEVIVGEYGYPSSHPTGRVYVYASSGSGLSATRILTITGSAPDDTFGYALANVGDVNGDGYGDFLVGAPGYNNLQGRAYLYRGGPSLTDTPATVFKATVSGGAFGRFVASAGDVNGDGWDDMLVGAPSYNSDQGRAFIYLGNGSGVSATPALTLTGEATANLFGQSGGAAGDVNGDGYADVVIGAERYGGYQGRAYLYLGGLAGLSATPAFTLTGEATGDYFGHALAMAGDVNGDGYADVLIGASGRNASQGRAYVYLGSQAGLEAAPVLTLTGETAGEGFGGSVGGAGDVNGDGYADLAIGAPNYNTAQGILRVYHGSAFLPTAVPQRSFTGVETSHLGAAVATAGDVNGDGYADILLGAEGYESNRGQAHLYLGSSAGLQLAPAFTVTGETQGDGLGASVGAAGDVNGDGYADSLIGGGGYEAGRGRAYIYLGTGNGLQPTAALTLTGESPGDNFGAAVGTAGDVNGDGYADFVIGVKGANRALVYLGGASLSATSSLTLTGQTDNEGFGGAVATVGDVNGDGYADVIIGAAGDAGQPGRAYVYFGQNTGLEATPALTLIGESPGDNFGGAVATAGDVNGDGYADIVVGASGEGRVYVYSGGASLSATPMLTLTSGRPTDHLGTSVGTAGDVNGDGYSEIIVGASTDGGNWGRAYIYIGGPDGVDAQPALTLSGESAGSYFGSAVSTAGDVDGDGYADVLVGAYGFGGQRGSVYLYSGNGGGGKGTLARVERLDNGHLIQPWGLSPIADDFRIGFHVRLAAVDPHGRGRIKLQTQVCPSGQAFSETMCFVQTSPAWMDVAASATVTLTVTDLVPDKVYRWRARLLYAPYSVTAAGERPNPEHGPWRRFLAQSQEADVHTARLYWLYLPLSLR
jgi:hypothetical protein